MRQGEDDGKLGEVAASDLACPDVKGAARVPPITREMAMPRN